MSDERHATSWQLLTSAGSLGASFGAIPANVLDASCNRSRRLKKGGIFLNRGSNNVRSNLKCLIGTTVGHFCCLCFNSLHKVVVWVLSLCIPVMLFSVESRNGQRSGTCGACELGGKSWRKMVWQAVPLFFRRRYYFWRQWPPVMSRPSMMTSTNVGQLLNLRVLSTCTGIIVHLLYKMTET
jgi:hypothetical protein